MTEKSEHVGGDDCDTVASDTDDCDPLFALSVTHAALTMDVVTKKETIKYLISENQLMLEKRSCVSINQCSNLKKGKKHNA